MRESKYTASKRMMLNIKRLIFRKFLEKAFLEKLYPHDR